MSMHFLRLPQDVTVFRFWLYDSTMKEGLIIDLCVGGLVESLGLITRGHGRVSYRSYAFLQTMKFSGWNLIAD